MTTTEKMAAHVERIAARRNVTTGAHSSGGRAYSRVRHVTFRPVKSVVTYAVALHELGHVLGRGRSAPRLEAEANAWAWALRNAMKGTVNDRFRDTIKDALQSYLRWACRRNLWHFATIGGATVVVTHDRPQRRGCPGLPPEGHVFWHLLDHGDLPRC